MHYLTYPSKDSTIFRKASQIEQNTGLDEILEVQKYIDTLDGTGTYISRALIQFDISTISSSIVSGEITSPTFYLNLSISEAIEIPLDYTIYAYPISASWEMGVGFKFDSPINTVGVSWKFRDSKGLGTHWATGSLSANVTSSVDGGSSYYTSSAASQSFSYESADIRMNITTIVNSWLDKTITNDGLVIKHTDSLEDDTASYGILKFFSTDTNTIYSPTLETVWDDKSWTTGSLSELTNENILINVTNLKPEYKENSRPRFRVRAREQYPDKTFVSSSQFTINKYLPESSSYSILDVEHENIIIPFSDSTKLSLDSSGNYFDIWMDSFQPERFYKIIFKVEDDDGSIDHYDGDHIFKIVR